MNVKKYNKNAYLYIVFALILALVLPTLAHADGAVESRVYDNANLLTPDEEYALEQKIADFRDGGKLDLVIVTAVSTGGKSMEEYADDFYDDRGFGADEDASGVLLLIVRGEDGGYISTAGYGIKVFTDAGISHIGEQITPELDAGDYAAAFDEFITLCGDFLAQAEKGDPYDRHNLPKAPFGVTEAIVIAVIVGLIGAGVTVWSMVSSLTTVRRQYGAENYIKNGSLKITGRRDLYLYRTVVRSLRDDGSSRGGSRVHRSSSGRSHGGGRF